MTEFAERALGTEALDYIRDRLADGKDLARYLAKTLDLNDGVATAYLPAAFRDIQAIDMSDGGLVEPDLSKIRRGIDEAGQSYTMVPVPRIADDWMVAKVQEFFEGDPSRVCICEDWMPNASDEFWSLPDKHQEWATFVDDDVYYVLLPGDSPDRILWAIRSADSPWPGLLAAMTSTPRKPTSLNRSLVPDDWRLLAENTQALVVGAYDGESLILWTRR